MAMRHPSVPEILAGQGEVARHLAECAACRKLAALGGMLDRPADEPDLLELPTVERSVYAEWREILDGRGGMGRTFRVRDRRLGRQVAIKELLEPALEPDP